MAGDPYLFKDFNNGDEVTPEDVKDCEEATQVEPFVVSQVVSVSDP